MNIFIKFIFFYINVVIIQNGKNIKFILVKNNFYKNVCIELEGKIFR